MWEKLDCIREAGMHAADHIGSFGTGKVGGINAVFFHRWQNAGLDDLNRFKYKRPVFLLPPSRVKVIIRPNAESRWNRDHDKPVHSR
ncbi:MAG: hypothetical protein R3D34_16085 [Nitratireductor sp.]